MENKTFFEDFKKFQEECPVIKLNATVKTKTFSYKYADLPGIIEVIKPLLHKYNFIYNWQCNLDGSVTCVISHMSGHEIESTCLIKSTDDPKTQGAAITYAKRYSLVALLGIVAEEDKDAPDNQTNAKPKISDKAFEQVKDKITNGKKDITKQCLLHFDLTQQQHDELLNLEPTIKPNTWQ